MPSRLKTLFVCAIVSLLVCETKAVFADGERDNDSTQVRRIPKEGVEIPDDVRAELTESLQHLEKQINELRTKKDEQVSSLLPDVEIFHRAVRVAIEYNEFFDQKEFSVAKALVATGSERAQQLSEGKSPWTRQTGLVVRGYRSRIDDTVQPYGLLIPDGYNFDDTREYRCDLWFHGRGETLSEVNFINQRMKYGSYVTPENTIVLHPYGRYSNAFKFAGEVDVLEALESTQERYRINEDLIASRGFSMGGAAAWQFAVHYPDRWFAANPGAGFSETPEFLKFFQKEKLNPNEQERALWHLYDCTDYAVNLKACPTIAYSGELDIQKQAADVMETALAKENIRLMHIIGPETKHSIHVDSRTIIEQKLNELAKFGRPFLPRRLEFVTYTLKYNKMHWITLNGLQKHWTEARIKAETRGNEVIATTKNIRDLTFEFPAGSYRFEMDQPITVNIDGQTLELPGPMSDLSWKTRLQLKNDQWVVAETEVELQAGAKAASLRKQHDLQGPIDDAFMDSFVVVTPTGTSPHSHVQEWSASEQEHAIVHWRRHFRGDAQVVSDAELTDEQIVASNLILFGDPASNKVLARISDQLPIQWTPEAISVGSKKYDASHHALILIYPNPLNPQKYVVLNSGFTFREYDYLNNARQVPKLPDWAIIDLNTPADSRAPGKVVDLDFFDESWQLAPAE
ncbi:Prolyl oligopeptidase family protein [Polystyrenella longa]|uniref:Prolyl oligopeptidase family protein n=1 Tax=Polystyrenella longa TaxID=2528007 RepID=A0A518CHI5_9PLAN|nr:prolyl oligopeptidase family serine peptidase [Polystyrenella longa]QDU78681.1 Prolyl oligopeptidase family protein [Polystyrenella longa]